MDKDPTPSLIASRSKTDMIQRSVKSLIPAPLLVNYSCRLGIHSKKYTLWYHLSPTLFCELTSAPLSSSSATMSFLWPKRQASISAVVPCCTTNNTTPQYLRTTSYSDEEKYQEECNAVHTNCLLYTSPSPRD